MTAMTAGAEIKPPSITVGFWVGGDPKGQPRPRAFARQMGSKWVARVYDAHTAEGWKALVAISATPYRPSEPIEGPVSIRIWLSIRRPKSHSRSNGELKAAAPTWCCSKPDVDNYAKAILDALTQLGFWKDDCQVVELTTRKAYCSYGLTPGARIEITELL